MRVVIAGAGFGGLELATLLSEGAPDDVDVVLIDQSDSFIFGYSKLDVMFGRTTLDQVRLPYASVVKPGVRFVQETITAIDPEARSVTTNAGVHEGDVLVIALGADYDAAATPGLAEHGDEFYSVAGAERLTKTLDELSNGRVVIGVCGTPYKCPPAPAEAALLLHDLLTKRGVRDGCEIAIVNGLSAPVPPSPDTSAALLEAFDERGIRFYGGHPVTSLREGVAMCDDGSEHPFELFLGVPVHRAPDVVIASGMTEGGYIPVRSADLATKWEGVYAFGDVATVGVPKSGTFAEGAARVVAESLLATIKGGEQPPPFDGRAACWIEFGGGRVGRVDIDFLSGPKKFGVLRPPTPELVEDKKLFGSTRRARWFGL